MWQESARERKGEVEEHVRRSRKDMREGVIEEEREPEKNRERRGE